MKLFLGTDICEIARIKALYEKYGDNLINKIFTKKEIEYCFSKKSFANSLAARFATKEAVSKALGVGLNGLGWSKGVNLKEIELLGINKNALEFNLYGKALLISEEKGINNWAVSVSHSENYATSTVIGYKQ